MSHIVYYLEVMLAVIIDINECIDLLADPRMASLVRDFEYFEYFDMIVIEALEDPE